MKRFWKKQVPALFLALVMVMSLMPAALAEEDNDPSGTAGEPPASPPAVSETQHVHNWGSWSVNGSEHTRTCSSNDGKTCDASEKKHSPQFGDLQTGHKRICQYAGCGIEDRGTHKDTSSLGWNSNATKHEKICECGDTLVSQDHSFSYENSGSILASALFADTGQRRQIMITSTAI